VSSECDEDVMRHLQQRPQCKYSKFSAYLSEGGKQYNKLLDYDKQHHQPPMEDVFNGVDGRRPSAPSAAALGGRIRPVIQRQTSVCHPDESDSGIGSGPYPEYYKHNHRSTNILKQQAIYASLA